MDNKKINNVMNTRKLYQSNICYGNTHLKQLRCVMLRCRVVHNQTIMQELDHNHYVLHSSQYPVLIMHQTKTHNLQCTCNVQSFYFNFNHMDLRYIQIYNFFDHTEEPLQKNLQKASD